MRWFGSLLLFLAFAAKSTAQERKLRVLTTFLPLYSLTVNVADELADVRNLLNSGTALHDYQLSPADMKKIEEADLIVANGLGADSFLERIVGAKEKVVTISDGLKENLIQEHVGVNPHIWLDPLLAAHGVTNILRALQKADAANAAGYATNATRYVSQLKTLDQEIAAKTSAIKNVAFLTYHDAFPYFTRRYGLKLVGVIETVPDVTPSPREFSKIHQTIRQRKAKALFTSPEAPMRMAKQIAKDSGMKLGELDPLETGTLSAAAYEEGIRRNAENLVKTLK